MSNKKKKKKRKLYYKNKIINISIRKNIEDLLKWFFNI